MYTITETIKNKLISQQDNNILVTQSNSTNKQDVNNNNKNKLVHQHQKQFISCPLRCTMHVLSTVLISRRMSRDVSTLLQVV